MAGLPKVNSFIGFFILPNLFPKLSDRASVLRHRYLCGILGINMNKNKAFSLIEMLVVLTIISLILGLTAAYIFNYRAGSALSLCANKIAAVLNQARQLSITNQSEYKVVFDLINNEFVVQDALNNDADTRHKTGNSIIIESTTFTNDTVTFTATGGLSGTSGSIFIKDNKAKFFTVKILNATGRIKVLNFKDNGG